MEVCAMPSEDSKLRRSEQAVAFNTKEIVTHYLGGEGARVAEALIDHGNRLPPVVLKEVLGPKGGYATQSADKQMSWGITKHDGRYKVAIILESGEQGSDALRAAELIERSYQGLIVRDVSARAHSSGPDRACKPLIEGLNPGGSISHRDGFPGTIGAIVRNDRGDGEWLGVLGASHVLAHHDAAAGGFVFAPGRLDGSAMNTEICGKLERYKLINFYDEDTPDADYLNCVDAALVRLPEPRRRNHSVPDRNRVRNVAGSGFVDITDALGGDEVAERLGMPVYKLGRTSGFTEGTLKYIGLQRQIIKIGSKDCIYTNVLAVSAPRDQPFSRPGDSGALVYTADGFGIGLVIGGTNGVDNGRQDSVTFLSPLDACLLDTQVRLLSAA
jgi:hypothetical protein